eukprot:144672_1
MQVIMRNRTFQKLMKKEKQNKANSFSLQHKIGMNKPRSVIWLLMIVMSLLIVSVVYFQIHYSLLFFELDTHDSFLHSIELDEPVITESKNGKTFWNYLSVDRSKTIEFIKDEHKNKCNTFENGIICDYSSTSVELNVGIVTMDIHQTNDVKFKELSKFQQSHRDIFAYPDIKNIRIANFLFYCKIHKHKFILLNEYIHQNKEINDTNNIMVNQNANYQKPYVLK